MTRVKKKKLKILIANGVNLDLLGDREPSIYGRATLKDMERLVRSSFNAWKKKEGIESVTLRFFQTNSEEKFLLEFDKGYAAAIINAGAWSHTSLAIADRLRALSLPYVEVHVSDVKKREPFRRRSFLKDGALYHVSGLGIEGYDAALKKILIHLFRG